MELIELLRQYCGENDKSSYTLNEYFGHSTSIYIFFYHKGISEKEIEFHSFENESEAIEGVKKLINQTINK